MYRLFLLLTVIATTILCLWLRWPWYTPAIFAVVLALVIPVWRRGGFWFAFLAGLLVWGIYAGYLHWDNQGRLSDRLAVTFGVANGWVLVAVTAMTGGLTTGLGGWFGASLRRSFSGRSRDTISTLIKGNSDESPPA